MDRGVGFYITPESHSFRESYNAKENWHIPIPSKIHHLDHHNLDLMDQSPSGHVMRSFAGAVARHKTLKLPGQGTPKSHHSGSMDTEHGVLLATETVHTPRGGSPLEANSHSYHISKDSSVPSTYRHEQASIVGKDEDPKYHAVSNQQFGSHEELVHHMQGLFGDSGMHKSLARLVNQLDDSLEKGGVVPDRRAPRDSYIHEMNQEPHVPVSMLSAWSGLVGRHSTKEHPEFGKPTAHTSSVFNVSSTGNHHKVVLSSTASYRNGHSLAHSYVLDSTGKSNYSLAHIHPEKFQAEHTANYSFDNHAEAVAHMNRQYAPTEGKNARVV